MPPRALALTVLLGALACAAARGATWTVRGDGTADFTHIQPAIDAASSGDLVLVGDGLYTGSGNWDLQIVGKDIIVQSESGVPAQTIIDCGGPADPHTAFWIDSGTVHSATITGFRIQNAHTAGGGGAAILVCETPPSAGEKVRDGSRRVRVPGPRDRNEERGPGSRGVIAIANCEILDCGITAVRFDPYAPDQIVAAVSDCDIRSVAAAIVANWATGATITGCDIEYCTGNGISVESAFQITDCHVAHCGGDGLVSPINTFDDPKAVSGSEFADNDGWGIRMSGVEEGIVYHLTDVVAVRNGLGGIRVLYDALEATNITASDNLGHGLVVDDDWHKTLQSCAFERNQGCGIFAQYSPGALARTQQRLATEIADCRIAGNSGDGIGGRLDDLFDNGEVVVRSTLVTGNTGFGLDLAYTYAGSGGPRNLVLESVTLDSNTAGAARLDFPDCALANSLATANGGSVPITCTAQVTSVTITCTDLWGNTGGDWVDWLAPYQGHDGNIAADPIYCRAEDGSYTIVDLSPCAPGQHPDGFACGLIGAGAVGCTAQPLISSIVDIPDDQGLQVRLTWNSSLLDRSSAREPITGYGVYRRSTSGRPSTEIARYAETKRDGDRLPNWDFVMTVPARGDLVYQYVSPTLRDSTASDAGWTAFFVSAMTEDPSVFFDSPVDSGYSVDNLVPPEPTGFCVAYGVHNTLSWQANPAPDLAWYEVYRGATADFPVAPEHLVVQTQALGWTDSAAGWGCFYKLVAIDDAGNPSPPADPDSELAVGTDDLPLATVLLGIAPNPFNPTTTIAYAMSRDGAVWLIVYDVAGRIVRELVTGEIQRPGRYEVIWNGCDHAGRHVASGTYAVRLETGGVADTRLVTLVK